MKKYITFLKSMWFLVALGMVFNLLFGLLKTEGAVYIQKISDAIVGGFTNTLPMLIIVGGGLTFLSFVIRWLGAIVPRYLSERFSYETRISLFEHLSKIPFLRYEEYSEGDLQSRFQNDTDKAGSALYIVLSRILNNFFLFVFSIWAMLMTNVTITLTALVIVITATVINQLILKNMKQWEKQVQASLAKMTRSLESTFFALETVKTSCAESYVESLYAEKQNSYCSAKMKTTIISAIRTLWYSVTENLCLYGSIFYLGVMGIQGNLSIGDVLMFIYLVKQIIMPIEVVFRWMAKLPGSSASMERINDLMNVKNETQSFEHTGLKEAGELKIENICFKYPNKEQLIGGASLDLKKSQLLVISGDSGSGKTTLLKIISGLYSSNGATYLLDGQAISPLSPKDIAYASIDKSVFPMSVYDNIVLENKSITNEQVRDMLVRLGFSDWINSLPDGLDSEVYENISGGQRQVIANARALLSERSILIFDEPFSALDKSKEKKLIEELKHLIPSHFVVLVSHRTMNTNINMSLYTT
jgi:ABC-type bacteriocin/lantibiotic exporter with double-glycine peptidase domain